MDISSWFFITSGLFLGWSLGANQAVNVFGTAVVSKMVKFRVAAVIAGIFVMLGAVFSGGGTTKTINELGAVNALAGSFAVAISVGISVTIMSKAGMRVSSSQAVIGGIVGWNMFTGSPTDYNSLAKIIFSWVSSPIIAGLFGFLIFKLIKTILSKWKIHLLELDSYTRVGLIVVGALASYSLGANNIANVMGMFISVPLFENISFFGLFAISGVQQLFFLGSMAIAVGIFTHGDHLMYSINSDFYKISPISGFAIVTAELLVFILFTSEALESFLIRCGLPSIPLVPLSLTQAFVGAIIGVGLAKDPLSVNFKILGKISVGWIVAPLFAGIITFISLFFIQNVFEQKVINQVPLEISRSVISKLNQENIPTDKINDLVGKRFYNKKIFNNELMQRNNYSNEQVYSIFQFAMIDSFRIDSALVNAKLDIINFSSEQLSYLKSLHGKTFNHKIDFEKCIYSGSIQWLISNDKLKIKEMNQKKIVIENLFRVSIKHD